MPLADVDEHLLDELLEWSDWRQVGVRRWTRICNDVTNDFWDLWRDYKDEIKAMGIMVRRPDEDGPFCATWVSQVDPGSCIAPKLDDDEPVQVRNVLRCPASAQRWYLREYQNDAYFTLLKALQAGITFVHDGSDAGMGKTWNALEVVRQLGWNFGVVCPSNVVTKWTNTAIEQPFAIEPEFVLSYDAVRSGRTDYVSREDFIYRKKKRTNFTWNTCDQVILIFDEIHMCAATDSLNAKLLKAAIDNPHVIVMGASATAANSPLELRTIGYGLELHAYDDWFQWCKKMGCRPGPFGGLVFNTGMNSKRNLTPNQKRARRKLADIHHHIYPKRGARIEKTRPEIAAMLPENQIFADTIDLAEPDHPWIKAAMAELDEKEIADEEKALEKEQSVSDLTLNTRARQRTELQKLPALFERVRELRSEGNSVIVFLNYSESIRLLDAWLIKAKEMCVTFVGGMTKREQDDVRGSFQQNLSRVIICQTEAGSASIDLDDTDGQFPRVSLISPGYSARQLIQALGRPHRGPTTRSKVMQWILFAANTVEERACRIVQHKLNNISLLNDGDLAGVIDLV
jgi:superfamily II DNA or RNA helicase